MIWRLVVPTLVGLVLLVAGVIYVVKYESDAAPDREKGETVLSLEKDSITRIEIQNEKTKDLKIVLEKDKDKKEWKIVAPIKAQPDSGRIEDLLGKLSKFESKRMISEKVEKLADYGLDKPIATVNYTHDKGQGSLLVGAKSDVEASNYLKRGDSDKLFMVESYQLDLLTSDLNSFRDKKVINIDTETAVGVKIVARDGATREFKRVDKDKWEVLSPVKMKASADAVKNMLTALGGVWVEEFVNDAPKPADLATYGLDKPEHTIAVSFEKDGGTRTLLVGKKKQGDDGRVYVKRDTEDHVYLVSNASLVDLAKPIEDFREKKLFELAAAKVKKVSVSGLGQEAKSERDDKSTFKFSNPKVRKEAHSLATALVNSIEVARAKSFAKPDPAKEAEYKLSPPEWVIRFEGEGIPATKLELGAVLPDKSRYVRTSDGTLAVLEADLGIQAKGVMDAYLATFDLSTEKANGLKVTQGKDVIEMTRAEPKPGSTDLTTWKVVAPAGAAVLDPLAKANAILDALASLPAREWLSDTPDERKKVACDAPEWTIETTFKDGAPLKVRIAAGTDPVRGVCTDSLVVKADTTELTKKLVDLTQPVFRPAAASSPAAGATPSAGAFPPPGLPGFTLAPASPSPGASPAAPESSPAPSPAAPAAAVQSPVAGSPRASPAPEAVPTPAASPAGPASPAAIAPSPLVPAPVTPSPAPESSPASAAPAGTSAPAGPAPAGPLDGGIPTLNFAVPSAAPSPAPSPSPK